MFKNLSALWGYDPARVMKQPDTKGPEPAKGSISFTVADFIGPGAPVAQELAAQCGYKVSPQAMQAASAFGQLWEQAKAEQAQMEQQQKAQLKAGDTAHGGAAERAPMIDKHEGDLSGALPGPGPV